MHVQNTADIAIIIPTKNEERLLPKLLKTLTSQTVLPKEIIIADAASTDKTVKIAKSFGAKVTKGGIPAVGRNAGAKIATPQNLIFIDADTEIPNKHFIQELMQKLQNCDVVLFKLYYKVKPLLGQKFFTTLDNLIVNLLVVFPQRILYNFALITKRYHLLVSSIAVKKTIYERIGGYKEVKLGEDKLFIQEATKIASCVAILKTPIYFSARRYTAKIAIIQLILMFIDTIINLLLVPFPRKIKQQYFLWWQNNVAYKIYKPSGGTKIN